MIVCQQELGPRRSEITYDRRKNFDNERCHDPHINRNQINVRKVSWIRRTGDFIPDAPPPVRTVGALTPTTKSTFGSQLRVRRVGEAELNNVLYPNHVMKCIHTVHRHKRCYECCCYSCCRAMQCQIGTQIHWRE